MSDFLNKEIVVKRTVKGYIISSIIITLVIILVIFLEIFLGIRFLAHVNPELLINIHNDAVSLTNYSLSVSLSVLLYIIPLICVYMLAITVLMISYESSKNAIEQPKKAATKKTTTKKTTKK